jgi:hypothetical protein
MNAIEQAIEELLELQRQVELKKKLIRYLQARALKSYKNIKS